MNLLEIAPDEFRRLAAEVTEIAADYLSSLDSRAVFPVRRHSICSKLACQKRL